MKATNAATAIRARALPEWLLSRRAPAAAITGRASGHPSRAGCKSGRQSMPTSGETFSDDASSAKQMISRPTSSGTGLSGAVTPTAGPIMSTARPEAHSTTTAAQGT